jgi:sulfotransferase 6B1
MASGGLSRELRRRRWTAQRFGFSPGKLLARVTNRDEPRIVCLTVPKSGTHLLERVLCLHPRLYRARVPTLTEVNVATDGGLRARVGALKPGQILIAHLPHRRYWERALVDGGVRMLFLMRDPRDVAVSEAAYVAARADHRHHDLFAGVTDPHERIRIAIEGVPDRLRPLRERLAPYAEWLSVPGVLGVRFEDLVGARGGGDDATQAAVVRAIFHHLGVAIDDDRVARLRAGAVSDSSPTFRRGQIGGWREAFDGDTAAVFNGAAGDLTDLFGYTT